MNKAVVSIINTKSDIYTEMLLLLRCQTVLCIFNDFIFKSVIKCKHPNIARGCSSTQ